MRSPDRKLPAGAAWGHDPGRRMRRLVLLLAACSCGAAGAVWAQTYDNPPAILDHYVEIAVGDIVSTGQAARVGQVWSSLVFWTAADAIDGDVPGTGVHDIPPDRYGLETSRTDKQLGASASSNGSTSAVEKSGIPQWLAFAIEHGAIDKTVNGTNLTLTTSPYSAIKLFGERDTPGAYQRYGFWRRIGLSASFPLDQTQSLPGSSFNSVTVSDWSVRFRVIGDRSTRSDRFLQLWRE